MFTFWAVRAPGLAALLILIAACSREQQDWRSAESAGSREAYTRFLEQHGQSELANQARLRVTQLNEEAAWGQANGIGSIEAYRQFLAQFPNGKWAETARIRIEGFSLGSLPRTQGARGAPVAARVGVNALQLATGVSGSTPAAPATAPAAPSGGADEEVAAAQSGPAAEPAPEAHETRAVMLTRAGEDGYGVQLGAFGSEASADREWQRLQGRFSPQLAGLAPRIVVAQTGAGQLYRLQAPASGEAQARALCDALREQSQACVPVIPR
jgi:cell division septation protein DedD